MSGGVRTKIEQAPIGAVHHWGNSAFTFRELRRRTFDPQQQPLVVVRVDPGLGIRSFESAAGEVFYRDRGKTVSAHRFAEELSGLTWKGARVLIGKELAQWL